MKKTLIIAAAALISASAFAQTVSSANVVGYNKIDLTAGQFSLISTAWVGTNNTVGGLFNDLPGGTVVYFWNNAGQSYSSVSKGRGGWGDGATNIIERGAGVFVSLPTGEDQQLTISGEVPNDGDFTNHVANGFSMISFPYPTDVAFEDTSLFTNSVGGDVLYFWNNGYTSISKGRGGWGGGETNVIKMGTAVFYSSGTAQSVGENQPYSID